MPSQADYLIVDDGSDDGTTEMMPPIRTKGS